MNGCLDAALRYLSGGFSVIPTRHQEKRPLVDWKEFQSRRPTESEVRAWYRRWMDAGVAIICGGISGLVVVDCDPRNGDGIAWLAHRFPPTPTAETGGWGRHYYFAVPPHIRVPKIPALFPGVDLQAEASYVVAPPSVHPSGRPYRWLLDLALGEVPLSPVPSVVWESLELRQTPPHTGSASAAGQSRFDLDQVLAALHGKRRAGNGWLAYCPVHEASPGPHTSSLSIGEGHDGRVLLHCFAGCDYRDIIARLEEKLK